MDAARAEWIAEQLKLGLFETRSEMFRAMVDAFREVHDVSAIDHEIRKKELEIETLKAAKSKAAESTRVRVERQAQAASKVPVTQKAPSKQGQILTPIEAFRSSFSKYYAQVGATHDDLMKYIARRRSDVVAEYPTTISDEVIFGDMERAHLQENPTAKRKEWL